MAARVNKRQTMQARFDSPLGPLEATLDGDALVELKFTPSVGPLPAPPDAVAGPLAAYFAGDLGALTRLRVAPRGTPFQARVWAALREIPAGRTASYSEVARAIGAPSAVRAVGAANGQNPIAIVVPCHRVIGKGGSLVGYGGGLEKKRWLLRHEGALLA